MPGWANAARSTARSSWPRPSTSRAGRSGARRCAAPCTSACATIRSATPCFTSTISRILCSGGWTNSPDDLDAFRRNRAVKADPVVSAVPRRVLVTGATGFVGRHTLAPLLDAGFEVHAVGRSHGAPDLRSKGVTFHAADLLDA